MTRVVTIITLGIVGIMALITWQNMPGISAFGAAIAELVLLGFKVCGGVFVFIVAVLAWWWIARQRHERYRMRDGAWALQIYNELPLSMRIINWFSGKPSPVTIYDHNLNPTPSAVIFRGVNVMEPSAAQLQYAIEVEKGNRTRAAITGDAAQSLPWFVPAQSGKISAPMGRMLAGAYDKTPHFVTPEPPQLTGPTEQTPQLLKLGDALNQARPDHWLAGQNLSTGQVAAFDPVRHIHGGIVGSTGTGKTSSIGYGFVAQALRTNYHVVILDPKGGADWRAWERHCEWYESDPSTFGDQVQAIWNEHETRTKFLRASRETADDDQPEPLTRMLVVIEEYGDLIATMRRTNRKAADATDATLDRLMRLSRATDIHLLLIDQYPEEWSPQVMAGANRWLACFQLAPGQGAKVGEYKAAELPPNGQFLYKTHVYDSWFVPPDRFPRLLELTPKSQAPRVIDGVCSTVPSSGGVDTLPHENAPKNGGTEQQIGTVGTVDDAGRWDDVVAAWFSQNPQALTGPALGISDLARAMCLDNEGNEANYLAYKGRAHPLFHEFRANVRLPGNIKFGTDISTEQQ